MDHKTVLVVEDNPLNMKLIRVLLQIGQFRVLEAENAETGLQIAREGKPDLILMDIQLPGMDGLAATRILKQDPSTQRIPVVALTSYAMEGDSERAKEAGCDEYITKPIDTREFLNTVRKLVQNVHDPHPQPFVEARYRKKILIVDDEAKNVKLLEAQMPQELYEITRAYNGIEALEKVAQNHPDLVLLDIMMPGMDGYEVTRKLKNDPFSKNIPVILVTALGGIEDKIKGLEAGADEFLNKPVQRVELLARARSLILFKELQEQLISRSQVKGLYKGRPEDGEPAPLGAVLPKVLVVEDDAQDAKLVRRYLNELPLELEFVSNGTDAFAHIEKNSIDLILLDILLPGFDGFEICRQLKKRDRTRNIQILVTTCLSDLQSKEKSFELGADDVLIKPINGCELKIRVNTLLRKKSYLERLQNIHESNLYEGFTDSLTGLYNRAFLKHFLNLEIKRSLRQKYPVALLMCAIDDFPKVLNSRGTEAGNDILREVGYLLKRNFREVDLPVHLGEEVFSVVLPYANGFGAIQGAERVRKIIQGHSFLQKTPGPSVQIHLSMGIALNSSPDLTVDQFIQMADDSLFQARTEGKGRVWLENKPASPRCEIEKDFNPEAEKRPS